MNFAIYKSDDAGTRRLSKSMATFVVSSLMILSAVSGGALSLALSDPANGLVQSEFEIAVTALAADMATKLDDERQAVEQTRQRSERALTVLATRVGRIQAELYRLESVASSLTAHSQLAGVGLDFNEIPAVGGPDVSDSEQSIDLAADLDALDLRLQSRERQLAVVESLVLNGDLIARILPRGFPLAKGWPSSPFGKRRDPFTGRTSYHKGMDIAGAEGTDIIAVADGVVSWSGNRSGYGLLVEITHGNGYATRYAHNKDNVVKLGDSITAGQVIAHVGSSGRSTGPHLHFEVWKDGAVVNPSPYLASTGTK